ncbi:MAG: aminoglycoside adenylyltransferase domain-containing protein [Thermomicrobiales bacterium]
MATDSSLVTTQPQPTPYSDVNVVLHDLLRSMRIILGDHFRGMYLSGSLALGDFAAYRSDIDYVVVIDADLSGNLLLALRAMHADFNASDSPWATEVEAAYIPHDALRRYDPLHACHPHIERGAGEILDMDHLGSDWIIQRFILREHGVILAGPDPRTLIDPIRPEDLRRSVVTLMNNWWGPMRDDPAPLFRHNIGYQAYAVLTMCRILYTLDVGAVVSKPVAARWTQGITDGRWDALIEHALAWRKDRLTTPSDNDLNETLDLILYTRERYQAMTQ